MSVNHQSVGILTSLRRNRRAPARAMQACLALLLLLLSAGAALAWTDNPMLHNSNRFSCSEPGYYDQASCTANGGTWNADSKWTGGWGTDGAGAKYGAIDCATCHNKNTGNIKRVRTTITAPNGTDQFPIEADPTPPAGGVSFKDARDGFSDFGDDANRGGDPSQSNRVCEVCHSKTKYHNYDVAQNALNGGNTSHYNKADCITCHKHNTGFRPLACDSCHGNPPTADVARAGDGLAFDPRTTGSTTAGKHAIHVTTRGYACTQCHNNYVMPVESTVKPGFSDISISFSNFGSTTGSYSGQLNLSYNNTLGTGGLTCSTVYCHSSGQSATGGALTGGDYSAPTWATAGTAACGSCHKVTEVGGLTSGSHAAHLGTTMGNVTVNGCGDCHTGAANDASAYASAEHVDGTIDVAGGYSQGASHAPANGYGTCNAASCHDDGTGVPGTTPTWGTETTDCSECHARQPATASHTKHLSTQVITAAVDCGDCHLNAVEATTPPTGHLDGNLDVIGYSVADAAKGGAPYDNCATTYCHSNGKGAYQVVTWGATSTGCNFCHGYPPAGSHSAGDTDCSSCHNHVNADDISFSVANRATHINGTIENQADDCLTCHGTGKSRDPEATDPDHKSHTSVATMLAGKKLSTSDYGNAAWWYGVSYDASSKPLMGCGQCHPADVLEHRDGGVDTKLTATGETGIPATNAKNHNLVTATFNGTTCSGVYCHSDGVLDGSFAASPSWDNTAFNANLTCASCHGNSPTTGTHNWHEVGIHYQTLYDDDGVGVMAKENTLAAKTASGGADAAHGNSTTSDTIGCQTCHSNTVAVEYNSGNSVCITCHYSVPGTPATGSPATGNELAVIKASSTTHLDGAKSVAFASLSGFKSKAQLRSDISTTNGVKDSWTRTNGYKSNALPYSFDAGKNVVPVWNSGPKTCSTVDCHNGIETPAWSTGSTGNCLACHTTLPQ